MVLGLALASASFLTAFEISRAKDGSEEEAKAFLEEYNLEYGRLLNVATIAQWAYDTNITDYNSENAQNAWFVSSQYNDEAFAIADAFNKTDFSQDIKRQLKNVGSISLPAEESTELSKAISEMGEIYGSTKVCVEEEDTEECYNLEPGLTNIMAESTDYDLKLMVWQKWRNQVGRANKPFYTKYVELKNKQAVLNDHDDLGDEWRDKYETDTFGNDVVQLYKDMEPLYLELHAYIRRKLYDQYGEEHIDLEGPLPAHLLGDMWGRFWNNLYSLAVPFPDKPEIVPNEEMKKQNYTVVKMFETGNNFYTGLGMYSVPDTFWNLSMLEKPTDGREVICHATAWDFYDG
jgi:hypothetical protein